MNFKILFIIGMLFLFTGCTKYFTLGEQETFQELYGKQYRNCGTNDSFVDILEDSSNDVSEAYENCIEDQRKDHWYNFFSDPVYEKSDIK